MRILRNLFPPRAGAQAGARTRRHRAEANRCLWALLNSRKLRAWQFRRQHTLGPYVVDFVCLEQALVVEVAGEVDAAAELGRRQFLERLGYRVLRFGSAELLQHASAVCRTIRRGLAE